MKRSLCLAAFAAVVSAQNDPRADILVNVCEHNSNDCTDATPTCVTKALSELIDTDGWTFSHDVDGCTSNAGSKPNAWLIKGAPVGSLSHCPLSHKSGTCTSRVWKTGHSGVALDDTAPCIRYSDVLSYNIASGTTEVTEYASNDCTGTGTAYAGADKFILGNCDSDGTTEVYKITSSGIQKSTVADGTETVGECEVAASDQSGCATCRQESRGSPAVQKYVKLERRASGSDSFTAPLAMTALAGLALLI